MSRFQVTRSRCLLLMYFLFLCAAGIADKIPAKLVIPDYPCAKDQYNFALMYEKSQFLSTVPAEKVSQFNKISQCYQRVIDSFPHDIEYVPRAYLQLGDCQAKIFKPDEAIKYYQVVLNGPSDDEYLHARALFATGQMLDMKKDYEAAKSTYKEVMDRYGSSGISSVRDITKKASILYFQVREQPAKSKWSIKKLFGGGKTTQ